MKVRQNRFFALIVGLFAAVAVAVVVFCLAVPSCKSDLGFSATYYYVCYVCPSDAHSAASVSTTVRSYGGAGYIVENGGGYYVTVSCYYTENDAQSVCAVLNHKGLSCSVLEVAAENYSLPAAAKNNEEKYRGNLATLHSLSLLCYDLANNMDTSACNQSGAASVLADVKTGLESLYRQNPSNCFSREISALIAECDDVSEGYIYSYDVRRLQIAITDAIVHVRLY